MAFLTILISNNLKYIGKLLNLKSLIQLCKYIKIDQLVIINSLLERDTWYV